MRKGLSNRFSEMGPKHRQNRLVLPVINHQLSRPAKHVQSAGLVRRVAEELPAVALDAGGILPDRGFGRVTEREDFTAVDQQRPPRPGKLRESRSVFHQAGQSPPGAERGDERIPRACLRPRDDHRQNLRSV